MAVSNSEIQRKVLQYEAFLNDVLKEDLKKIHKKLDHLQSESFEYLQLKNYVGTVKANNLNDETMKTQVDIGGNVFIQANIEDPNSILISVGLEYYVDVPLDKGIQLIDKKLNYIQNEIEIYKKKSAVTKSHIKIVLLGLMEIQNLK